MLIFIIDFSMLSTIAILSYIIQGDILHPVTTHPAGYSPRGPPSATPRMLFLCDAIGKMDIICQREMI
jgi:hypothetical protein